LAEQEGVSRAAIYARIQGNNKPGGMVARISGLLWWLADRILSKNAMIEKLIGRRWNRLAASNNDRRAGSGLDLGFQVMDGEFCDTVPSSAK